MPFANMTIPCKCPLSRSCLWIHESFCEGRSGLSRNASTEGVSFAIQYVRASCLLLENSLARNLFTSYLISLFAKIAGDSRKSSFEKRASSNVSATKALDVRSRRHTSHSRSLIFYKGDDFAERARLLCDTTRSRQALLPQLTSPSTQLPGTLVPLP